MNVVEIILLEENAMDEFDQNKRNKSVSGRFREPRLLIPWRILRGRVHHAGGLTEAASKKQRDRRAQRVSLITAPARSPARSRSGPGRDIGRSSPSAPLGDGIEHRVALAGVDVAAPQEVGHDEHVVAPPFEALAGDLGRAAAFDQT